MSKKNYICTYHKNKNGMGGIAVSNDGLNIHIGESQEKFALDNDVIEVEIFKSSKDDYLEGKITNILEHKTSNLVGYIQLHRPKCILRVNNPKFGRYLVYLNKSPEVIDREELVTTKIVNYPTDSNPFFEVDWLSNIEPIDNEDEFINELLASTNLPVEFSYATIQQSEELPTKVLESEIANRVDLRHIQFVTIDGEDAKDFDDAVFAEFKDGLFRLYVAIADVSHYVAANTPLDQDAYLRGTSVYLPKLVIPMLPEIISNGLCSLNPHVDRLTICCQMDINQDGEIVHYEIYEAVIHSHARLTYNEVQHWLNDLSNIGGHDITANISNLYLVYKSLLKNRERRGAIDFDTVEPEFDFDELGEISEIVPRIRLDAHRLIEECMLAANVSVADFLIKSNVSTLFRIHDKPSLEKFTDLKNYLNLLAIKFDVDYDNLEPRDYARLLDSIKTHVDFETIQNVVLRSMQLAIYSPNNIGHFGLGYKSYLHFTSPIRRYPDLLVHRTLRSVILHEQMKTKSLVHLGEHTSYTEQRSAELERKVDAFYKCKYAKNHIGKSYDGIITSVVNFGLFVYIKDLMVDGLVHISELGEDYFMLDDKAVALIGKSSGIAYKLGQLVHVEIVSVNMAKLFIDLKTVV